MSAGRNYLMLRGRREGGKKGGGRREGDKKGGGRERGQHVGNICLVYFSNDHCVLFPRRFQHSFSQELLSLLHTTSLLHHKYIVCFFL